MNAPPGEGAASGPGKNGQPVPGASSEPGGLGPHHGERQDAEDGESLGGVLRARREACGLTILQAAEALYLDPAMIAAIEADRFAALGAPVYARGHLRKYAIVLGLSPEWAIERYEALADVAMPLPAPISAAGSQWRERSASKVPLWITLALLAAGVAWGVYGLYQERSADGRDVSAKSSSEILDELTGAAPVASFSTARPPAAGEVSPPAEARLLEEVSQQPHATEAVDEISHPDPGIAENRPQAVPAAGTAASAMRLRLAFTGTSWTEVYDATGKQLVFGMGTAETVYDAAGVPPLRVILGYASAVNVQVNDRAIVIPRRAGRNTARFIIEPDGSAVQAELTEE